MLWDWGPFMKGGGKRKHKISPCAALMIRRRVRDNPGTNDLKAAGVRNNHSKKTTGSTL